MFTLYALDLSQAKVMWRYKFTLLLDIVWEVLKIPVLVTVLQVAAQYNSYVWPSKIFC